MAVEPLYEKIIKQLKDDIQKGILQENEKLPTEVELAKQFNVSRITSKRAMEELRIQGYIYRIQGSGSFIASRAKWQKSFEADTGKETIALVLPFDQSLGGMLETIKGASDICNSSNCILSIHSSHSNLNEEKELLKKLYRKGSLGIIHYPLSDVRNFDLIHKFYLDDYPIVTIDKYFEGIPICSVVSDNLQSECDAVKFLIKQGHKKIGFLSNVPIEDAHSIRQRYFGYCRALKEAGLPIDDSLIFLDGFAYNNERDNQKKVTQIMQTGMTALVCLNDYVASSFMREVINQGYRIPEDLSIIGFDDLDLASHLQVPLTTIAQDFYQMGKTAAELILETNGNSSKRRQVVLPSRLIIRESTGKLK